LAANDPSSAGTTTTGAGGPGVVAADGAGASPGALPTNAALMFTLVASVASPVTDRPVLDVAPVRGEATDSGRATTGLNGR